jgi:hypothetical protein
VHGSGVSWFLSINGENMRQITELVTLTALGNVEMLQVKSGNCKIASIIASLRGLGGIVSVAS